MERPAAFASAGLLLEGKLALPAGSRDAAVLCHPHPQFGGSMDNNVVIAVASGLRGAGLATLRFNFRGVGASQGRYGNMVGEVVDTLAAVAFLREQAGLEHIAVVGYSFGAAVGLRAGLDAAGVDRLVAIAPPIAMFDAAFLRGCSKPLLFVAGTDDPFCPEGVLEQTARELTLRAEIVRLRGADHFFFGREEELGDRCAGFLRGIQQASGGQG